MLERMESHVVSDTMYVACCQELARMWSLAGFLPVRRLSACLECQYDTSDLSAASGSTDFNMLFDHFSSVGFILPQIVRAGGKHMLTRVHWLAVL